MYPETWTYDVCEDPSAAAESDAYERGRWEAIKEAATMLQVKKLPIAASIILSHEAQLKQEREARRTPVVNNCALANGDLEANCQMCPGRCPARSEACRGGQ